MFINASSYYHLLNPKVLSTDLSDLSDANFCADGVGYRAEYREQLESELLNWFGSGVFGEANYCVTKEAYSIRSTHDVEVNIAGMAFNVISDGLTDMRPTSTGCLVTDTVWVSSCPRMFSASCRAEPAEQRPAVLRRAEGLLTAFKDIVLSMEK